MDDLKKRLTILKNDLTILKVELKNYEPNKSHFSSKQYINLMINLKEKQIKELTLMLENKESE
jgi:hypothetical protein